MERRGSRFYRVDAPCCERSAAAGSGAERAMVMVMNKEVESVQVDLSLIGASQV